MMDRGLDHLVYATPDLDASVEELANRLGTDPVPGGAHPGWGTRNALIGLGTGVYLEIIGPDSRQPEPDRSRPFLIDELTEARLVTWAYRHPDPECMRDTLELALRNTTGDHGVRLGPVRKMSRTRPDGATLHWRLSDPMALPAGGVVPFVIDWGATPHPSAALPNECRLLELVVSHPDPMTIRPVMDALRPVLDTLRPVMDATQPLRDAPDGETSIVSDISIVAATEPGIRARIRTPNGEIDLS